MVVHRLAWDIHGTCAAPDRRAVPCWAHYNVLHKPVLLRSSNPSDKHTLTLMM
jgi:hypothetical protein